MMQMKISPNYRFGFNGMLRDDDVRDKDATIQAEEGLGNSYDFGARVQDPRIGHFLSLDPLMNSFPWQSPYLFAGNDPINFIDFMGMVPTPYPLKDIGSIDYYLFRYNDFKKRNPNLEPPKYYLDYGYKYAKRFSNETFFKLSKDGMEWLKKARKNLQILLEEKLKKDEKELFEKDEKELFEKDEKELFEKYKDLFEDFVFKSHVNAYWEAGLTKLNTVDLVAVILTPDIKDLIKPESMEQASKIMMRLGEYWVDNPEKGLIRGVELILNITKIQRMFEQKAIKAIKEGIDIEILAQYYEIIIRSIPTIELENNEKKD